MPDLKAKSVAKKPRGLGRGLDALLGDRPSKVEAMEPSPPASTSASNKQPAAAPACEVPIEFLKPNSDQPRKAFSDEAIAELAISIKTRGVLQPILVRPIPGGLKRDGARYEIVAGERRWRASQKAELHSIPVIIRDLTDQQTAEIALIENVQRVDLSPMEEAEAYHFLSKNHGRNQEDIAKAVCKSRSHVANMMRLTSLPKPARDALVEGVISMGHARALLGSKNVSQHLSETLSKKLSVRQLEGLIRQETLNTKNNNSALAGTTVKNTPSKDADTRSLERDLASALGLEVAVNHKRGGTGNVTIQYLDLDQLDEVCRRLLGSPV